MMMMMMMMMMTHLFDSIWMFSFVLFSRRGVFFGFSMESQSKNPLSILIREMSYLQASQKPCNRFIALCYMLSLQIRGFFNSSSVPSGKLQMIVTVMQSVDIHAWSLTARPWKMIVGRRSVPFWVSVTFQGRAVKLPAGKCIEFLSFIPATRGILPGRHEQSAGAVRLSDDRRSEGRKNTMDFSISQASKSW